MIARTFALCLVFSASFAGSAFAQEAAPSDYARPGYYAGLAGSVAFTTKAENELQDLLPFDVNVDESLGLHVRGGYRYHPRIATELHFEYLEAFEVSGGGGSIGLEFWTLTTDTKIFLATGRTQPFAAVGFGVGQADVVGSTGNGFVARLGGGVDFYLTERIVLALDAAYVVPTGDLANLDFVSVGWGLQYRFGGRSL